MKLKISCAASMHFFSRIVVRGCRYLVSFNCFEYVCMSTTTVQIVEVVFEEVVK